MHDVVQGNLDLKLLLSEQEVNLTLERVVYWNHHVVVGMEMVEHLVGLVT